MWMKCLLASLLCLAGVFCRHGDSPATGEQGSPSKRSSVVRAEQPTWRQAVVFQRSSAGITYKGVADEPRLTARITAAISAGSHVPASDADARGDAEIWLLGDGRTRGLWLSKDGRFDVLGAAGDGSTDDGTLAGIVQGARPARPRALPRGAAFLPGGSTHLER